MAVAGILILFALLIISRLFWGPEIAAFEERALESVGLGGWKKYLVIVPLLAWYFVSLYSRAAQTAAESGRPVVRRSVAVLAIGLLVFAVVFMFVTA